jgi:spore germination cell wall hydrolase CwlJ-like protein
MKRIVPPMLLALAAFVAAHARTTPDASSIPAAVPVAVDPDALRVGAGAVSRNGFAGGDAGQFGWTGSAGPSVPLAPVPPRPGEASHASDEGGAVPASPDTSPHPPAWLARGDGTTPRLQAGPRQDLLTPAGQSTILAWVTPTGIQVVLGKGVEARQIYVGLIEPEHLEREERCLAQAVYFEARSEVEEGRAAVAQVVLNRVKSGVYPTTVCGVVFQNRHRKLACQFTFACEGKPLRVTEPEAWKAAMRIARDVYQGKIYLAEVGAATHYHADYVQPQWAKKLKKRDVIGRHIFYS